MKIAFTADPEIAVPPLFYGGIERIIDMLITELSNLGHKVTLFAHSDSVIKGRLIPYQSTETGVLSVLKNSLLIRKEVAKQDFDIIHSFGRLAYLLPILPSRIPKLMSYQREPTIKQIKRAVSFARKNSLRFTGCSEYIANQIKPYAKADAVYNGVDFSKYELTEKLDDEGYLVFLGRIEPIKGTHTAIEIALQTQKKLVIAGNIPEDQQGYFDEKIKPFLGDQISYVGPVNDEQKNKLLRGASAFLMPIHWNEPFGIVMVEAMACGTPVIGLNKGAVPEVVENGITGFRCNQVSEMIVAIGDLKELNRTDVYKRAKSRFSAEEITRCYLDIYQNF